MTTRARHGLMLSVLLFSCSSGTGPRFGILNVKLGSLRADDGAVLFTISGGPVESVEAVSGTVRSAQITATTLRVVITGNLSAGAIARVRIADASQASRYSIAINQVAARSTYVPRDPGQYSITLAP
jgi:hypothetical protein